MSKYVIPGQYIKPTYKLQDGSSENVVEKYISGKGTTILNIEVDSKEIKTIPVISSTILGQLVIQELKLTDKNNDDEEKEGEPSIKSFLVTVMPKSNTYIEYEKEILMNTTEIAKDSISINLPQEGDIVLVRVTRLNLQQAYVEILTVEGHGNVLSDSGVGTIGEVAHKSLPIWGGSQPISSHTTVASSQSTLLNAQSSDLGETFKGIIRLNDIRSTERDKLKIIECFKPGDIVRAEVISLGDGSNYYLSTARNDLGVIFAKSEGGAGGLMYAIDWQTMICEETGVIENRKCAKPFN
ncbi:5 exonuclease subunit ski4 [Hyphopichia burtonii NRRL Y-1933]|uniref:5 exonuclease subunit ski4 n=1 Tax=Hyphopichia burtonii NRRL Y-1933 TaxID=984485 RepID=A0A1E4RIF5_9ASCO|nr:5 exonuclease subunit ski4 [Hyphopichia burtonii NRRL Y-1933]ODV67011.1 5 exonuclease subunit ski4 [Hyphopichia burtonii NRRL Y-1933]